MYEFSPNKRDNKIAPIWVIFIALISLLIGANITLYFVKNYLQEQPAGQSPLGGDSTPTPLIINTPATSFSTSPEASASIGATTTPSQSVVVD